MREFLDYKHVRKFTNSEVKTDLRKSKKGISVIAIKPISKGSVVAYYRVKAKPTPVKSSVNRGMYLIMIYNDKGRAMNSVIGDVGNISIHEPNYNVPYWGYFMNEPSMGEKGNCSLDINTKGNYSEKAVIERGHKKIREGDHYTYKIRATKDVGVGEELMWCYGEAYARKYDTPCAKA